ncbi:MAG: hypothetical protein ABW175_17340 [Bradyrhizobium sp.]
MARKSDKRANSEADDAGGALGGLLAEETEFDGRMLWRVASWGVAATAAVVLALMANQSSPGARREQVASADIARQAHQIATLTRESQVEARRLAAAVDTLSGDRDRLYKRVTSLEQGLDSVTGAITKPAPAPITPVEPKAVQSPQPAPSPAPVAAAPATAPFAPVEPAPQASPTPPKELAKPEALRPDSKRTENARPEPPKTELAKPEPAKPSPATPLMPTRSMMAPPDDAAGKFTEPGKDQVISRPLPDVVASTATEADADDADAPKVSVQRTEFGVDVGTANSLSGLRALWRGLLKSRSNAPLATLRPIVVIKENTNGLGMQLRLVAGPLTDAGAAAKICAAMTENNRSCETTVFEGQRLSLKEEPAVPAPARPAARRHNNTPRTPAALEEKKPDPPPPPPAPSGLSAIFNRTSTQ